jgi:hypothetical protein
LTDALGGPRSSRAALGYIVAVAADADDESIRPADDILGVSLDHLVVYFASDPQPGDAEDELARRYHVPARAGFHLARLDPMSSPGREQERAAFRACRWQGLCVNTVWSSPSSVAAQLDRWDYELCMASSSPSPDSCTFDMSGDPTPERQVANEACTDKMTLMRALGGGPGCSWAAARSVARPNEGGFDAPVTLTLGATLVDWHQQFR